MIVTCELWSCGFVKVWGGMPKLTDDEQVAAVLERVITKIEKRMTIRTCAYEGCNRNSGQNRFCGRHQQGTEVVCKVEGCETVLSNRFKDGLCEKHAPKRRCEMIHCQLFTFGKRMKYCEEHLENPPDYVLLKRIRRDSALRKKHFDAVYERQNGMCTDPMLHCYYVEDGKATSRCPFLKLNERVPKDMAELDHIVPLCEGGSDDPDNLQVLCACCHAAKSKHELHYRRTGDYLNIS